MQSATRKKSHHKKVKPNGFFGNFSFFSPSQQKILINRNGVFTKFCIGMVTDCQTYHVHMQYAFCFSKLACDSEWFGKTSVI